MRWNLTGTEAQKAIAAEAFRRIKFDFVLLTQLPGVPELGWDNLNAGAYARAVANAVEHAKAHGANTHGKDLPHPLIRKGEDGRSFTLGLIYTRSGRIYLDVSLESDPDLAMEVLGMEAFHAVDIFLPMTDDQRNELLRRWAKGGTWWEVSDYSREYFQLGGEAFMYEGLGAYSDFDLGPNPFLHNEGVGPEDVRRILGIPRTDAPVTFGKSKVYHKVDHYERKVGKPVLSVAGLRPCRVCKP